MGKGYYNRNCLADCELSKLYVHTKSTTTHDSYFMNDLKNQATVFVIDDDDELKSSLVFVMSTSNNDEDIFNAYHNNAAGYLLKGTSTSEFSKIVNVLRDDWNIVQFPTVNK
jgi:hypothetical protein